MGEPVKSAKKERGTAHLIANIIGVVLCVIFIPVIVLNMILIVRSYADPEKIPTVFGISPVIVMSNSMYPEFAAGDMIFLQTTDPNTLRVGDVICYYAEGDKEAAVTHRIVDTQTQQDGQPAFITRGDANNTEDRIAVTSDMVQGKYVGLSIPGLGNVAIFLQSPLGMVICVVCPLLLLLLWDIARRMLSSRKKAGTEQEMAAELERLRAQVAQGKGNVSESEKDVNGPEM